MNKNMIYNIIDVQIKYFFNKSRQLNFVDIHIILFIFPIMDTFFFFNMVSKTDLRALC